MANIHQLLSEYGASHQNATNKLIHWVCVPLIMFSLMGLLYQIPFPFAEKGQFFNWAGVFLALALLYYLRLSLPMFIGFLLIAYLLLWGIHQVSLAAGSVSIWVFLGIFVIAWIGQFIGHNIEGKKPSFIKDLQFLLIGPAWLLHFIYKQLGVRY